MTSSKTSKWGAACPVCKPRRFPRMPRRGYDFKPRVSLQPKEAPMTPPPTATLIRPNSPEARDIAHVLHPYTDLKLHQTVGPMVINHGKGVRVWDEQGKSYIESVAGLWCASLGFDNERLVQAAANQMVKQGDGGAIVAISSISALVGGEMQTHYTPTKAGVHSLMQSCAVALGRYGIRCNSVLPGTIATDINKDDLSDPAKRTYMEGRIPLGRLGRPEDIASVVAFLASDMAGYMSGAALLVDGGAFANFQ
jgi:hypothetical protein